MSNRLNRTNPALIKTAPVVQKKTTITAPTPLEQKAFTSQFSKNEWEWLFSDSAFSTALFTNLELAASKASTILRREIAVVPKSKPTA